MNPVEPIALSEELLRIMRDAARHSLSLHEAVITPRTVLLALLDDPQIGPILTGVVDRKKVESLPPPEQPRIGLTRRSDDSLAAGEVPAIARYDTLAFKTPDGLSSVWLSRDAFTMFQEGCNRVEGGRYLPKHLAFGLAAEAVRSPGVLTALHVEPGRLTDAIYAL